MVQVNIFQNVSWMKPCQEFETSNVVQSIMKYNMRNAARWQVKAVQVLVRRNSRTLQFQKQEMSNTSRIALIYIYSSSGKK